MRVLFVLLVVLGLSDQLLAQQCKGPQCQRVAVNSFVRNFEVLNREVAGSRVVSQGPIFDGSVIQAVRETVLPNPQPLIVHPQPTVSCPVVSQPQCCQPVVPQCCQPAVPRCCQPQTASSPHAHAGHFSGSAQAAAQAEADYMAAHRIRNRHVGNTIGNFEGVGYASHGQPPTCTPKKPMILIADAVSCNSTGCYRVRAWR